MVESIQKMFERQEDIGLEKLSFSFGDDNTAIYKISKNEFKNFENDYKNCILYEKDGFIYFVDPFEKINIKSKDNEYNLDIVNVDEPFPDNINFTPVYAPKYICKDINNALVVGDVSYCSALSIINKKLGEHYMGHIDPEVSVDVILKSLEDIEIDQETNLYILFGSIKHLSFERILLTLMEKDLILQTKIINYEKTENTGGREVSAYRGGLYLAPDYDDEKYDKFAIINSKEEKQYE